MLSGQHFYHRITRKMVVAFGSMFNNIKLYRYNLAGTTELERVIVPLNYISKEKFYQRITQDPNLDRRVQLTLPRMSFELTDIAYDTTRKLSPYINQFGALNDTQIKTATLAPYNFNFALYIYVRNTEDGTQIIEQILPYFNPDYTMTLDLVGVGNPVDVPLLLQGVNYSAGGSDGPPQDLRMLQWNLSFTMKGYLYGPVSNAKIIRKVTANTYAYNSGGLEAKSFTLNTGSGDFKIGEAVYQGRSLDTASVRGFVSSWSNTSNVLIVNDVTGSFKQGTTLKGAVSNASYNLYTYASATDYQLNRITVEPDPLSANINTAFGFDIDIDSAPNIT